VRCPTLIIRGAHSAVFPPHNLERLASLIPGAHTMAIDADHRVSQDNPRALATALDAFIGA
jgi:pimeloyl-ACP methyl ester carboxylesterase